MRQGGYAHVHRTCRHWLGCFQCSINVMWIDIDRRVTSLMQNAEVSVQQAEQEASEQQAPWDGEGQALCPPVVHVFSRQLSVQCAMVGIAYSHLQRLGIVLLCARDVAAHRRTFMHGHTTPCAPTNLCCTHASLVAGYCGLVRICDDEVLRERGVVRRVVVSTPPTTQPSPPPQPPMAPVQQQQQQQDVNPSAAKTQPLPPAAQGAQGQSTQVQQQQQQQATTSCPAEPLSSSAQSAAAHSPDPPQQSDIDRLLLSLVPSDEDSDGGGASCTLPAAGPAAAAGVGWVQGYAVADEPSDATALAAHQEAASVLVAQQGTASDPPALDEAAVEAAVAAALQEAEEVLRQQGVTSTRDAGDPLRDLDTAAALALANTLVQQREHRRQQRRQQRQEQDAAQQQGEDAAGNQGRASTTTSRSSSGSSSSGDSGSSPTSNSEYSDEVEEEDTSWLEELPGAPKGPVSRR